MFMQRDTAQLSRLLLLLLPVASGGGVSSRYFGIDPVTNHCQWHMHTLHGCTSAVALLAS